MNQARADVPAIFDYKLTAENDSMFNTPPTYAWYLAGLVFKWLKRIGGLEAMNKLNQEKADYLYNFTLITALSTAITLIQNAVHA